MGETAYLLLNASVLPVWALMVFAPSAAVTQRITATPLMPVVYAVVYTALLLGGNVFGGEGHMGSLAGLRVAFEQDSVLLLAWVHYLCFDMAMGMWAFRDAQRLELSWARVAPCLLFTLLLGPFGFAAYVALRFVKAGATAW